MRLDHLLSKEHLAAGRSCHGVGGVSRPMPVPSVYGVVLTGGTSTTAHLCGGWRLVRLRSSGRGEGTVAAWCGGGPGTLLGPEGTAGWLLSRGRASGGLPLWGEPAWGGGLRVVTGVVPHRFGGGWRTGCGGSVVA